jgi:hypothetical protein
MSDNLYWLISITSDSARVSLVSNKVESQGQEISWDTNDSESLLKAIDTSLSSQNSEATSNCSFIIPPTWVSEDGKIFPEMLTKLKHVCEKLKLRPLGQITHDDAFVESYNRDDSFPSSYILVYFSLAHYQISLVYLGQIKKQIVEPITENFSVSKFEEILANLDFSSAIPPKIIVTGTYTTEIVDDLSNYNWLSHKQIETFLHLPDVITIDLLTLDQIFIDTIQKQTSISPTAGSEKIVDATPIDENIEEVNSESLGFTLNDSPVEIDPIIPPISLKIPKISFKIPKISINYYWLFPIALLPFLPVLPLFFSNVDITIFQTPVEFSENFDITLDPKSNVSTQTFDLSVDSSIPTTGKREVGEKAKGEVTFFNKLDRSISVNKGLVITDVSGNNFETTTNILLPGSTYNLDTGVINMGQVKASVVAKAIGPESNSANNTTFTIKDNANLLAKSTNQFTGGTREQVSVVTTADRANLLESAKQLLRQQANKEINSQKSVENSILESTMVYDNQKTVFNREVGEDTDTLTLNLTSRVSFLYFNFNQKQEIISLLFPKNPKLSTLDSKSAVVSINYDKNQLSLAGKANPTIDINNLKSKLTGKNELEVKNILNSLPGFYNYQEKNSLSFINLLGRLPVKTNLINILIKN